MLLIVLGLPIGERGSWIERHASSADEANDLRSMLRLAADDVAVESPDPLIGQSCGPWRICRRLGEGGQGVVYEAEGDQGVAAVKVLHHGGDGETADKLNRETTALAAVDHNGLVRLRGSGVSTIAGRPRAWIAMDLIIGAEPLLDWAALHRPTMDERIELLVEIAASLAQAHAAGVIHRDLKSSNVLVGGDGRPRIIDLGIARVLGESHLARTRTNERHALVGTLDSLAPEQVDARLGGVTERTDVYALGVLAYRFLAGEVPYDTGISIVSAAQAILHVPPVPPEVFNRDLSASASAAIMRALEKHPADRWPSVAAFAAAIGPSSTTSATPHTDSRPRRRGLLLATCAVATTAAAFAVWMSVDGTNHKPPHGAGGGGIQEGDGEMKSIAIGAVVGSAAFGGGAFGDYYETAAVQWSVADGGNGHWYQCIQDTATCEICWDEAQARSVDVGGYLATVTSAAETTFMVEALGPLVMSHPNPEFGWGGGGYGNGSDGEWVTGEPWDYTNWGIINNQPSGDGPRFTVGGPYATPPDTPGMWNDIGGGDGCFPCLNFFTIEWSADCNGDGIVDYGQILDGTYEDADGNGVPDCCEDDSCDLCAGDIFEDGAVTIEDLLILLAQYGTLGPEADIDGNGIVNIEDLLLLVGTWGDCP